MSSETVDQKFDDAGEESISIPEMLPVLPLRDIVIYPYIIVPLSVSRDKSIQAVDAALTENRLILLLSQKQQEIEDPEPDDLYTFGTAAVIMRMLKLPDGRIRVLVQGLSRVKVKRFIHTEPFFQASVEQVPEPVIEGVTLEMEALMRNVKSSLEKAISLGKAISPEVMVIAANLNDLGRLSDLAASNLDLKISEGQQILEIVDPVERLRSVNTLLSKELKVLAMQQEINTQARGEIDRSQREYFLRQQLKAIQAELGEGNEAAEEIEALRQKASEVGMPAETLEEVEKQIRKLERMHPDSAETATLRNYLDWMVELPWAKQTRDNLKLKKAQQILDEDHFGLDKVKERIIEYLAVRKLKKKMKGPILCFVGPPGVGKTSLGRSIARALGRKFVRLSLGGVRDEAEIRGHRRTYVGALPGRIIQGIHSAGSSNPVFMLDEVDKVGSDYRGDPSSALLEVLDPEQNFAFRDHYLSVPYDLSHVMFITTANVLDTIQPAFLDRMEVIHLPGYMEEEKLEIARRHLLPKQLMAHGLSNRRVTITDGSILEIVRGYTREAGLRNLERELAAILRKVARQVAEGRKTAVRVTSGSVRKYLGHKRILKEELLAKDQVGVATGLAWTAAGGDILFIETTLMPGKGQLILTGQLGDVMKESAHAALSYIRSRAKAFGISAKRFTETDIHIHVPEGAIPKDGPSAGITLATSLVSALSGRPVHRSLAMTGEITLRGNVLPVGGIKEKVLAARRAKITDVVVPATIRNEVEEIPRKLLKELRFTYVNTMDDVLARVLVPKKTGRAAGKKKAGARSAKKKSGVKKKKRAARVLKKKA